MQCSHFEIQILLDVWKECEHFKDISKKSCNVIPRTLCIVKLVLTSPVSFTSSERYFSRLKLVYNHLRMILSDRD